MTEHRLFDRDKTRVIKWDLNFFGGDQTWFKCQMLVILRDFPENITSTRLVSPFLYQQIWPSLATKTGPEISHPHKNGILGEVYGLASWNHIWAPKRGWFCKGKHRLSEKSSRWWQLKYFWFSPPILVEMIQFDEHIFQMGWTHQSVLVGEIWFHLARWSFDKGSMKMSDFWSLNGSTGVTDLQRYCLISIEILVDWG